MRSTSLVLMLLSLGAPLVAQTKPGAPEGTGNQFRILTGITVAQTGLAGNTADLEVTLNSNGSPRGVFATNTATTYYGRPAPTLTGHLGSNYTVQTYGGFGSPARALLYLANPDINALEVGETGSTPLDSTVIPAVVAGTPGQFRGTFQHTYAAPGTYTARAGAMFNVNFTNATTGAQPITVGNPVQVATGSPLSWTSVFRFYSTTGTNTSAFTYSGTAADAQTVGVTNTAQVTVAGPTINPLEIPSATEIGLLSFAALLAVVGVTLLRR